MRSWLGRGAFATVDSTPVTILKTRLVDDTYPQAAPGSVLARDDGAFTIQCGDGALAVVAYSDE